MNDTPSAPGHNSLSELTSVQRFRALMGDIARQVAGRDLDAHLERWLNDEHGRHTLRYSQILDACLDGIREGWMCARERGGIRYGRVLTPSDDLSGFSVDVVDMDDVVGPHHVHPNGEIDLVMPLSSDPRFDGRGAGWCVYPSKSSHAPTVAGGRALVLYLLPDGKITFTGE
jgi:Domain of unknown function (DUF4863)